MLYCFLLANEEVLNEDNVDIIDTLKEGGFESTDRRRLGMQLRIKDDDLETIENDYHNKATRCLEKTGKATYTGLAEARKKMGEDAAADHISLVMEERPEERRSVLQGTLSDASGSVMEVRQERRRLLGK